jgi:hypothetical protein
MKKKHWPPEADALAADPAFRDRAVEATTDAALELTFVPPNEQLLYTLNSAEMAQRILGELVMPDLVKVLGKSGTVLCMGIVYESLKRMHRAAGNNESVVGAIDRCAKKIADLGEDAFRAAEVLRKKKGDA